MSVINSVLKDLDNKPSAFTPLSSDSLPSETAASVRRSVNPLLLVVVSLLIAASLYAYWLQQSVSGDDAATAGLDSESIAGLTTVQPSSAEESAAADTTVAEPVARPPRNSIVGLQINEDPQGMTLDFELAQGARSFIKQRSNNRYVFVMRDVTSAISVPYVSDNPWLERIAINASGDDVEIRFDTQPGVLVESGDRSNDGRYLWRIRLKKPIAGTEVAEPSVKPAAQIESAKPAAQTDELARLSREAPSSAAAVEQNAPVKLRIRPVAAPLTAEQRLSRALKDARSGQLAAAHKGLLQLLDGPLDRSARVHLLEIAQGAGNQPEFRQILRESLQRYPTDEVFLLHESNRLFAAQQYQPVIDQLSAVAKPTAPMLTLLATSHQRIGQHREAAEYYVEALELDPRQPRTWISLGISQQHLGDREQALQAFRMAPRSGALNQRLQEFVQTRIQQLSNLD